MQKRYMELLLAQIRDKRARESVRQEVEEHIREQKACYIADGMMEDEAEEKAVVDMGDPVEAGSALDQVHRPKPAWGMLAMITILCAAGVILQYAAYIYHPTASMGNYYFKNQCWYAIFGLLILYGVYLVDYTRLAKYGRHLCTGILLLLFLAGNNILPIFRLKYIHGAMVFFIFERWFAVDLLFYLYLPFYGAVLYTYRNSSKKDVWKILLYTVLPIYFAGMYGHLSAFINVTAIVLIMFGVATAKGWFSYFIGRGKKDALTKAHGAGRKKYRIIVCLLLMVFSVLGAWIFMHLMHLSAYQSRRIQAWLNPSAFAKEEGYISNLIRNILHSSQLIGQNTTQPIYDQLPEYTTNYILTYMIGTFGVLVAAAVVMLVVILGAKLLYVSIRQKNQLGMMMGLACSSVFVIQSVEYILVNLTLLPASGLYFPLISFGGSGMLQTCILLGILLSIYRYENVVAEPKAIHIGDMIS